jgi:alpha-L-fucosidase
MKELGAWLKAYGEAVYGTRVCPPYHKDRCAFTRKGDVKYAFYLYEEDSTPVHEEILIPFTDEKVVAVDLVGGPEKLDFTQDPKGLKVKLPAAETSGKAPFAHVFRMR